MESKEENFGNFKVSIPKSKYLYKNLTQIPAQIPVQISVQLTVQLPVQIPVQITLQIPVKILYLLATIFFRVWNTESFSVFIPSQQGECKVVLIYS